jgi:hypothetical protein
VLLGAPFGSGSNASESAEREQTPTKEDEEEEGKAAQAHLLDRVALRAARLKQLFAQRKISGRNAHCGKSSAETTKREEKKKMFFCQRLFILHNTKAPSATQ